MKNDSTKTLDVRINPNKNTDFQKSNLDEEHIYTIVIENSIVYYGYLSEALEVVILGVTGSLSKLSIEEQEKKLKQELLQKIKLAYEWDLNERKMITGSQSEDKMSVYGTYCDYIYRRYGVVEALAQKLLNNEQLLKLK